ncbi:hypothetical protein TorRG33x02_025700, partial [Trema orientale]
FYHNCRLSEVVVFFFFLIISDLNSFP